MKSIAFICKFSWVGISTSVINSAIFWESKGYCVDIYTEKPDQDRFSLPNLNEKKITFIITEINNRWIVDDVLFCFKYFQKKKYEWVIGFDHLGLIRGGIALLFKKNNLIYHSLEFFEPTNTSLKNRFIKFIEVYFAYKAKYIFTQDGYRINFLKADLLQNVNKFKIINNTPMGNEIDIKSNYFRSHFNISQEKKIILCVGTLIDETLVKELADSIELIDKIFVLVFHGWFPNIIVKNHILELQKKTNRIYISEKLFSHDRKNIPFQSCDIGFVGFKPVTNNLKYSAGSGGKIYDFLRNGKPIVCYTTPGMKELIESNQVGFCFSNFDEINSCLIRIAFNYESFKKSCFALYNRMEFGHQYEKIFNEVLSNT